MERGDGEQPDLPLPQLVYPEIALLEALGISKEALDTLRREKGVPCIYLNQRHRVYLAREVSGVAAENTKQNSSPQLPFDLL